MQPVFRQLSRPTQILAVVVAVGLCGLVADVKVTSAQGAGSHITVLRELGHDTSPRLETIPPLPPQGQATQVVPLHRTRGPFAPAQTQLDTVVQTTTTNTLSTNSGQSFLGLGKGFTGPQGSFAVSYIPPDTNGAIGATQYVQWVNASFAVFDKNTGNPTYGPAAGNTLWNGFSGANGVCSKSNSGDPIAQYDKVANRWVLMQPVFKSPYYICIAVSQTSDALGAYDRYVFPIPSGQFPDYPKLSVWADGYYLTYNQFQRNFFMGAAACVMDRSKMLLGQAATMQCATINPQYGSLLPADFDGTTTTLPPAGSPGYFLNYNSNLSSLDLWRLHVDWNNASNSILDGPVNISVASFNEACGGADCIAQAGTSQTLDSLGDRLMYRLAYRNFPSDHESLVVSHSVDPGTGNSGIRWYELRDPNGTPFVYQQGTYVPDSHYRWMSSIGMDKFGNIAMGYSVSGSDMSPTIRYTGRAPSDTPGTMRDENDLLGNIVHGSQTTYNRWGDYSSMTVDPVDDCTFWYTTEYQPTDGYLWSTRIASFRFGDCSSTATADFSISTSPGSLTLTQGQSATSSVNVSALNGFSGTVDFVVTGCPNSPANACSISPTSVAGSGSTALTVITDATTSAGSYNIIVKGMSGSLTHSVSVGLTVKSKRGKK